MSTSTPNWLNWPQTKRLIAAFADSNAGSEGLRFVGGAVRDFLLGIEAKEIDAATPLTPDEVMEVLDKAGIRTIPTGLTHGTITALVDGTPFEITTLRRDTACDGRHAQVIFGTDWREDAARRDFTINALYMNANGEVFDYFSGIDDLKSGRVRFIGEAEKRVQEDYLRILRFFRFYAFFGKGEANSAALGACRKFAVHINTLSGERIQHEMLKLLAAPDNSSALHLMLETGVFAEVFGFGLTRRLPHYTLAALLLLADTPPKDALAKITTRWKLSNKLAAELKNLIVNPEKLTANLPTAQQKSLIRELGKEVFCQLANLKNMLEPSPAYLQMAEFAQNWQIPFFPVSGDDLLAAGLPAGKTLGEKLRELEKIWEQSDYSETKEILLHSVISKQHGK